MDLQSMITKELGMTEQLFGYYISNNKGNNRKFSNHNETFALFLLFPYILFQSLPLYDINYYLCVYPNRSSRKLK